MEVWRWSLPRRFSPVLVVGLNVLLLVLMGLATTVMLMRGRATWDGGNPELFQLEGPRIDCPLLADLVGLEQGALGGLGDDLRCVRFDHGLDRSSWQAVGSLARLDVQKGGGATPSIGPGNDGDLESWKESKKGSVVVELRSGVKARVFWGAEPGEGWDVLDRWVWNNARISWVTESEDSWLIVDLIVSSPDPRDAVSAANQLLTK